MMLAARSARCSRFLLSQAIAGAWVAGPRCLMEQEDAKSRRYERRVASADGRARPLIVS